MLVCSDEGKLRYLPLEIRLYDKFKHRLKTHLF